MSEKPKDFTTAEEALAKYGLASGPGANGAPECDGDGEDCVPSFAHRGACLTHPPALRPCRMPNCQGEEVWMGLCAHHRDWAAGQERQQLADARASNPGRDRLCNPPKPISQELLKAIRDATVGTILAIWAAWDGQVAGGTGFFLGLIFGFAALHLDRWKAERNG